MDQQNGQPPRINMSMGRKHNIGNYQSVDLHASFSRDLLPGESPKSATYDVLLQVLLQLRIEGLAYNIQDSTLDNAITKVLAKKEEEK